MDTHVLLWWGAGEDQRLSEAARAAIESESDVGKILISSVSAWEIAHLAAQGRVGLSRDVLGWLDVIGRKPSIRFVPVDNEIAVNSVKLGGDFHKDPADRYIVATSQKLGAPLVTADEKIRRYQHVRTIW